MKSPYYVNRIADYLQPKLKQTGVSVDAQRHPGPNGEGASMLIFNVNGYDVDVDELPEVEANILKLLRQERIRLMYTVHLSGGGAW